MKDYAKPYKGVQHFGIWAAETADLYGTRDAVNVLAEAVGLCFDDDVRQRRDVLDALEYLARIDNRPVAVRRFRKALDEPNPVVRFRAAGEAVRVLQRHAGS